jgi:hypothetical protein
MSVTIKRPRREQLAQVARVKNAAPKVAVMVCYSVLDDAVNQQPKVPVKRGFLQGSGNVREVEGGAEVAFDAPYALYVHEAPANLNWTEPGSGPKFLEAKVFANGDKYNRQAAEFMRGLL